MRENSKYKRGSSGPNPLVFILIVILIAIGVFFLATYLVNFVPNSGDVLNDQDQDVESQTDITKIELDTQTLSQGVYSKYSESGGLIIENESNLKTLWSQTAGGPVPSVNFAEKVVLAAFAGDQPTTGYSIRIDNVVLENDIVTTNIYLITPGQNCDVGNAVTNPYHIVTIDKQQSPIEFVSYDEVEDCD